RSGAFCSVKEYPVSFKQIFKLQKFLWEISEKIFNQAINLFIKIAFHSANTSNIGCQSRTAYLFIDIIYFFTPLKHIGKTCKCACINSNDRITNQMISDACKFHNDNAHVLSTFGN